MYATSASLTNNMNSISTDDWETKKSSIARLYRDENGTLKEVLNEVRTHSFDPSEAQLRHQLKKWGVTKATRLSRRYNWRGDLDQELPGRQALVALETVRPMLGAELMTHVKNDPTTYALDVMEYTPSGLLPCNADTGHVAINHQAGITSIARSALKHRAPQCSTPGTHVLGTAHRLQSRFIKQTRKMLSYRRILGMS